MKTSFVVFVTLMIVAIISQSVVAQTPALNLLEGKIKEVSANLEKAEKSFELEKARQKFDLQKQSKKTEMKGLRSNDPAEREAAALTVKSLNSQIDSISKIETSADIQAITKTLYELQQRKIVIFNEELAAKIAKSDINIATTAKDEPAPAVAEEKQDDPYDRKIPTRLTKLNRNQRSRSHEVRVDELVISQIENNISSQMTPAGQNGGYKVIFDNMYSQPVNFIARSTSSSVKVALVVEPGVMRTKYMLPGKYMVEIYINGRLSGKPMPMTIDGQECDYKGIACFNYAFAPKF